MRFVFVCLLVVVSLSGYSQDQKLSYFWKRKSGKTISFKVLGTDTSVVTSFQKTPNGGKVCTYSTDSMRYVIRLGKTDPTISILDSTGTVMMRTKVIKDRVVWESSDGTHYTYARKSGKVWEYTIEGQGEPALSTTFNRQGGRHIIHTLKKPASSGMQFLLMYSNLIAIEVMKDRGTRPWIFVALGAFAGVTGALKQSSTPGD